MNDPLLKPAMLKLARCQHHIGDLNVRIQSFLAERPFKLVTSINEHADNEAHFIEQQKPIPDELSLIIGDAIHNLRSALDITMYGIVGPVATNPDNVQFPFPKRKEGLMNAIKSRQADRAGKYVVAEIERLEPYPGGSSGIDLIHKLDIDDKHKLIIPVATSAEMIIRDFLNMIPIGNFSADSTSPITMHLSTVLINDSFGKQFRNRAERRSFLATNPLKYERSVQPFFELRLWMKDRDVGPSVVPALVAMHDLVKDSVERLVTAYRMSAG